MKAKLKFKGAGFLTKIVVVALLVYMAITLLNLRSQIQQAQDDLATYQAQVVQQQQINAELESDVANGTAEDKLEDIARYKLGLVEPGEKVFYDITN
jgi:cell division protein FtsL